MEREKEWARVREREGERETGRKNERENPSVDRCVLRAVPGFRCGGSGVARPLVPICSSFSTAATSSINGCGVARPLVPICSSFSTAATSSINGSASDILFQCLFANATSRGNFFIFFFY